MGRVAGGTSHLLKFYWLRILNKVGISFLKKMSFGLKRKTVLFRASVKLAQVSKFIGINEHAN